LSRATSAEPGLIASSGFAAAATTLVSDLFPSYAANLERARTSYRPVAK